MLTFKVSLWSNMKVVLIRLQQHQQHHQQQKQKHHHQQQEKKEEHVVLHWSRGFQGWLFLFLFFFFCEPFSILVQPFYSSGYYSFYSLSSLFIVNFNLLLCSYGRDFVQRQLPSSTSLRRIGSTFSLVLFFRLVSSYEGCSGYPFVKGMQRCFCLSFCGLEIQIVFTSGCGGSFTWTLLKVFLHVGVVTSGGC